MRNGEDEAINIWRPGSKCACVGQLPRNLTSESICQHALHFANVLVWSPQRQVCSTRNGPGTRRAKETDRQSSQSMRRHPFSLLLSLSLSPSNREPSNSAENNSGGRGVSVRNLCRAKWRRWDIRIHVGPSILLTFTLVYSSQQNRSSAGVLM